MSFLGFLGLPLAGGPGFEPGFRSQKSDVVPLNYPPTAGCYLSARARYFKQLTDLLADRLGSARAKSNSESLGFGRIAAFKHRGQEHVVDRYCCWRDVDKHEATTLALHEDQLVGRRFAAAESTKKAETSAGSRPRRYCSKPGEETEVPPNSAPTRVEPPAGLGSTRFAVQALWESPVRTIGLLASASASSVLTRAVG